jgi:sphingolipid delta-4 desaturase
MAATNSSTVTSRAKGDSPSPAPAAEHNDAANKNDFFWTYTEEPHRTRRLAIIKAHPEVRAIQLVPR